MKLRRIASTIAFVFLAACSGSGSVPSGSTVGYAPSPAPGASLAPQTVNVSVTVGPVAAQGRRRQYLSTNTQSLLLQLTSVNGAAIPAQPATAINTYAGASNCKSSGTSLVCTGTVAGADGADVFSVIAYAQPNGTGSVLSSGSFQAQIGASQNAVTINNSVSLTLSGVIASLSLSASPSTLPIGTQASANIIVNATDASGAVIVGPGPYASPITVSLTNATADFGLVSGANASPQQTLTLTSPATVTLAYNGNASVSPTAISIQAQTQGPSGTLTSNATVDVLPASPPPTTSPPPGSSTLYVLNAGSNGGTGATVTEYAANANGDVAPIRTIALSATLYAVGFAVDSSGAIYVGYYDNAGFVPDSGNEIDVYAPNASGTAAPARRILADPVSQTTLDPGVIAVDASKRIVTLVDTQLDNQGGGSAAAIYAANATGPTAPTAWNFDFTGAFINGYTNSGQGYVGALTTDASDNFYVAGALYNNLNPVGGIFTATAAASAGGTVPIARTIPSDAITTLPSPPDLISGLALDGDGFIYAAQTVAPGGSSAGATVTGTINVFAPGATSGPTDAPPLRALTSTALNSTLPASGIESRLPLAVFGDSIYVGNEAQNGVVIFPTNATGSIAPSMTISGASTALNAPIGIAVAPVSATKASGTHTLPEKHPHP